MSVIKITATGLGDDSTPLNDLIFKIYNGATDALITTTGSHTTDADVTVTGTTVVIDNVDVGALGVGDTVKVTAVDDDATPLEGTKSVAFTITSSTLYLKRIASSEKYILSDDDSYPSVVTDPETVQFSIKINPPDFTTARYLYEIGSYGSADHGTFYIRINTDGKIQLYRADANSANPQTIVSTDALTASADNTVELNNGVLTINGTNQSIDMSAFNSVTGGTARDYGTIILAQSATAAGKIIGDIKELSYEGNAGVFASSGVTFTGVNLTEYNDASMVAY